MKVSVIIPTYNEEGVIGDCLESLNKQSFKDLEVIVTDDGSSDRTLKVLSELRIGGSSSKNYELRIFKQQHKGPGEARNLGAREAKGGILVFVDADMTFDKFFLKELVEPISKGESKGTFSKNEIVSNYNNIWAKCWNINKGINSSNMHPKSYPDTQKVFRAILKSEFERVNGFETGGHYTDDWSLSNKLGYEATVSGGRFYHQNPDSLLAVFNQSKWVAKREYKLGVLGFLIGLIRVSLPVSVLIGLFKSFIYKVPQFLMFKIISDLGSFIGILQYMFSGKGFK